MEKLNTLFNLFVLGIKGYRIVKLVNILGKYKYNYKYDVI